MAIKKIKIKSRPAAKRLSLFCVSAGLQMCGGGIGAARQSISLAEHVVGTFCTSQIGGGKGKQRGTGERQRQIGSDEEKFKKTFRVLSLFGRMRAQRPKGVGDR